MTTQTDQHCFSIAGRLGLLLKDGARGLVDLIGRIVNGFMDIAQLAPIVVLGVACEASAMDPVDAPAPAIATVKTGSASIAPAPDPEPKPIGSFSITFYYVIGEEEVVAKKPPVLQAANDNESSTEGTASLATIVPPETVTLYAAGSCQPIAEVSREFGMQLDIQGTGKLRDGRVLNVWGRCACDRSPCFKVTKAQWGTGGNGHALQPFRTVAVDPKVIKLGSLLHIPLLEGRQMPGRAPWGGFIHDGCVIADDVGGGIKGRQLDLFVGRKGWFLGMSGSGGSHAWARNVPVLDGSTRCQRDGRRVSRRAGAI